MTQTTTPPLGLVSDESTEDSLFHKVTLRLVPFLFVCYLGAYLDRVNVGFAKLQMQKELALSETVYGLGAGIFFLGYVLFEVPSNIILHKVGARLWLARVMLTWAIISAATAFVKTATAFYIMRFLLGMAEAGGQHPRRTFVGVNSQRRVRRSRAQRLAVAVYDRGDTLSGSQRRHPALSRRSN